MPSMILSSVKNMLRSSAFKLVGGILCGAFLTVFIMRIWSSVGPKYILIGLGGILFAILILVLIYLLWKNLQTSKSKQMEGALGESVKLKKQRQQQLKTAVSSLKDKWSNAMATLKSAGINIYDMPWVLLIGEPQSGKTTTLQKSGLDFPIGRDALSGAGGTVNCDWWFTNDAVVIDTAGRFTMPVDSAPDKDEWHAFLRLLAKYRPKCPINSIVVTIPITSLLEDDPQKIEDKANKIKGKLLEVTDVLGVEYPVYIMISKSDLMTGFTEFCASLSSIENTQILGWNCGSEPAPFDPNLFNHQFENLAQRFYKWSLRRLRDLPVGSEADRIFSFPSSFRQIKGNMSLYLDHIFKGDKFHSRLLHRGCFFSSGLQEGKAIAQALEDNEATSADEFASSFVTSRPYFIYNFYKKVFLENGLVRRVGNVTKRERNLKISAIVFACLFSIISVWYLWTGYSTLTKVLKPVKSRIEHSMKVLVSGKGKYPTTKASDIVNLAETIKRDRNYLSSKGVSYRFLKGKDNSMIRDMKNIEDALLMKGLFRPILSLAADHLNKRPDLYQDKISLYRNLALGLGVMVDSPDDLYALKSAVILAEGKDPWLDIEPSKLIELAESFPRGDSVNLYPESPDNYRLFIRQELTGLNNFWKVYPGQSWQMLKKDLTQTMDYYISMLENPGLGVSGDFSFKNRAKGFKDSADRLVDYSDGENAVFPDRMLKECTDDYTTLATILDKGENETEKAHYESTLNRHSTVCDSTYGSIKTEFQKYSMLFDFMLNQDGGLHPEFKRIHSIINSALGFSPLFQDRHKQLVSQNPDRITNFLEVWDTEWHELRVIREKEINDEIALLVSPAWKKEKLAEAIGFYLQDVVWEADLDAALACIDAVIKENSIEDKVLTKDMALPNATRTKWLEEKFTMFAGINDWLVKKYPSRPDISRGTGLITGAMLEIYKDYLVFWNNTLDSYDPSESIIRTTDWKSYRNHVLEKRGLFLDPGSWPFNLFLENITVKDIDSLKKLLGEDRDQGIIRLEKNLTRTAFVYSMMSGNIGSLSTAQDRFYQCVDSLPDTASDALNMLNEGKMADFKSFSSFRHKVDSGLGGGEILASRLEEIEYHGLNILKKGFASGFSKDQKTLINNWYDSFKRKYPFTTKGIQSKTKRKSSTITATYSTVAGSDFYDFCYDDILSVKELDNKYGIKNKIKKSPKSRQYRFMKNSLSWKEFLFDKDEKPKVHNLKVSMDMGNLKVSKSYTVIKIKGLHEKGGSNSLRLRFSGNRYKSAKGIWSIDSDTPVEFSAINEETGKTAAMVLSGSDLALPAYLVDQGKKRGSSGSRKWSVGIDLPDPDSAKKTFKVNLLFEWDEDLPDNISWSTN